MGMPLPPLHSREVGDHIRYLEESGFPNAARELENHVRGSLARRPVFRGDFRSDLMDDIDPSKIVSGAGIYFTEDPEIASGYAEGKVYMGEGWSDYAEWFRIRTPRGEHSLGEIGKLFTPVEHYRLIAVLGRLAQDEEEEFCFSDDPSLDRVLSHQTIAEHVAHSGGDAFLAAKSLLLDSGMLYEQEGFFQELLREAGVRGYLDDPRSGRPGVTPMYLCVTRPLLAHAPAQDFVDAIRIRANTDPSSLALHRFWDELNENENAGLETWAFNIPAEAVRVARSLGYDGVLDKAYRKGSDQTSPVWVTFSPAQSISALSIPGAALDLAQQAEKRGVRRPRRM